MTHPLTDSDLLTITGDEWPPVAAFEDRSAGDPVRSLRALGELGRSFLLSNPAVRVPARVLLASKEARARYGEDLATTFGVRSALPSGAYLGDDAYASEQLTFASDAYACIGSFSHGSGRSFFVDDYQLKGVGRTNHAVFHPNKQDSDGSLGLDALVSELGNERAAREVLSQPPIPHEVALVTLDGNTPRLLLARRGSPLRIAHLVHLVRESHRLPPKKRPALFHRFLRSFGGARPPLETLHEIVLRGVTLAAEARVFALDLRHWYDNADVFSRIFDCELLRRLLPHAVVGDGRTFPRAASPREEFLEHAPLETKTLASRALQSVHNAFFAVDLLLERLEMSRHAFDETLDWSTVDDAFVRATANALARASGLDEIPQSPSDELLALARDYPLELPEGRVVDTIAIAARLASRDDRAHATSERRLGAIGRAGVVAQIRTRMLAREAFVRADWDALGAILQDI